MLGDIFKNLRKNLGWSQEQFAEKANVSAVTVCKAENNGRPSKKVLTKLLNALCLNIDDLLTNPELTDEDRLYLENKKYEKLYYGRD